MIRQLIHIHVMNEYLEFKSYHDFYLNSAKRFADSPAEDCSLPFTYNAKLYMGCVIDVTGIPCNYGCLTSNRKVITCERNYFKAL